MRENTEIWLGRPLAKSHVLRNTLFSRIEVTRQEHHRQGHHHHLIQSQVRGLSLRRRQTRVCVRLNSVLSQGAGIAAVGLFS
mmetsp:Transcript_11555/g.39734  ORF Transcript_11555/g.39734 Transcript_11555/m.39734 type:complete len:82 (+) Transcript_11555:407-652(+)